MSKLTEITLKSRPSKKKKVERVQLYDSVDIQELLSEFEFARLNGPPPRLREYKGANPNFGLVGDPVTPVQIDYLALGMAVDKDIYWALLEYFDLEKITLNERFYIEKKKIWHDKKEVGRIVGSQGAPSEYGRKIQFHFTGEFFRGRTDKNEDRGGEKLAYWCLRAIEQYIAALPVLSEDDRLKDHYDRWLQRQIAAQKQAPLDEEERLLEQLGLELRITQGELWSARESLWSCDDQSYYKAEIARLTEVAERTEQRLRSLQVARLDRATRFFEYRSDELIRDFTREFGRSPEFPPFWRKSVDAKYKLAERASASGLPEQAADARHQAARELLLLTERELSALGYARPPGPDSDELREVKRAKRTMEAISKLRGKLFCNFVSIDRVDYAVNCRVAEAKTPISVARHARMLDGWFFSDAHISTDGISCYASSTKNPLANRGTHPHLCVYQDHELASKGLIRFEIRFPAVRSASGNAGPDATARTAARHLSSILARSIRVDDDPQSPAKDYDPSCGYDNSYPDNTLCVYPLDFGNYWVPDHVFSSRYRGHGTDTTRRLGKQAVTIFEMVVSSTIASADFAIGSDGLSVDDPNDDRVYLGPVISAESIERVEAACLAYRRAWTPDVAPLAIRVRTSQVGTYPVQLAAPASALSTRSVALAPAADVAPLDLPSFGWDGGGVVELVEAVALPSVVEVAPPRKNTLDSYLLDYETTQELAAKAWVGRYKRSLPVAISASRSLSYDYEVEAVEAGRVPPIRATEQELVMRFPSHYARSRYLEEWERWKTGERTRPPRWAVRAAPAVSSPVWAVRSAASPAASSNSTLGDNMQLVAC